MKKLVMDFVAAMGCKVSYSGNQKKMFIKGKTKKEANNCEAQAIAQFGFGMPFALASQKG